MPNSGHATQIREALLTSPHVEEVLVVQVESTDAGVSIVGVRISLANVPELAALPQVIAQLRALVRAEVGETVPVFIEPDLTEPDRKDVSTESIVIRSWD